MKTTDKKSPLKSPPLRNPGQSLDEEIDALWNEKAIMYWLYITGFLILAITDWQRWITKAPVKPITSTIVFAVVFIYCSYKLIRTRQTIKRLKLARDGEKAVGQYLDELRDKNTRVLHDIKGDNFNVDHVIVSEHGIFVVDTKTYQKPTKGDATVRVQGDDVFVNNYLIERSPIKQSCALTKWIQELIEASTGKKFPVKGVVVFPGWFVEKMTGKEDIWVLNPKALPTFVRNHQPKIRIEDVSLVYFHLSRYVRTKG